MAGLTVLYDERSLVPCKRTVAICVRLVPCKRTRAICVRLASSFASRLISEPGINHQLPISPTCGCSRLRCMHWVLTFWRTSGTLLPPGSHAPFFPTAGNETFLYWYALLHLLFSYFSILALPTHHHTFCSKSATKWLAHLVSRVYLVSFCAVLFVALLPGSYLPFSIS